MSKIEFIYWSGVVTSAIICLILTLAKREVRVADLIGVLLNIICSWATPISLIGIALQRILQMTNRNGLIWKKKEQKNSEPRIIRRK